MATLNTACSELRMRSAHTVEEAALQHLALRNTRRSVDDLLGAQLPGGAWPNVPITAVPNAYATSLALIALAHTEPTIAVRAAADRGFAWLGRTHGREGHWLWQWKFRLFDRQVRFDPSKSGWPWVDGTVSWVAPTAMAIVAHYTWRRPSSRVEQAVAMLLDRACPAGGWNAGNSQVFGVDLAAHPDFTAMGLIALHASGLHDHPVSRKAEEYLLSRLPNSNATYSLAWATLALHEPTGQHAEAFRRRLDLAVGNTWNAIPTTTLALAALALKCPIFDLVEGDG